MDPKASFGTNETLRIVVPGYYFLAMLHLYLGALNRNILHALGSEVGLFMFLIVGLAVGFVFFTLNYPNRRMAYTQGQPSEYLLKRSKELAKEWGSPPIELRDGEHIQLYLYILNNFIPQTFHEVVMVRGGLYFCITYVWSISLLWCILSALSLVLLCLLRCLGYSSLVPLGINSYLLLSLYCVLQFVMFAILYFPKRADRILKLLFYDQTEWMKLNEPLITYLLEKRLDPRAFQFLSPAAEADQSQ
jgi:hypothetical protein